MIYWNWSELQFLGLKDSTILSRCLWILVPPFQESPVSRSLVGACSAPYQPRCESNPQLPWKMPFPTSTLWFQRNLPWRRWLWSGFPSMHCLQQPPSLRHEPSPCLCSTFHVRPNTPKFQLLFQSKVSPPTNQPSLFKGNAGKQTFSLWVQL